VGGMTNSSPRILIISHGHPALVAGGTEFCAYDLFCELNRTGAADASFLACVTALHRPAGEGSKLQSYNGAEKEYLLHVGQFDPFMLAHGIDSATLDDFGRLLDRLKPDIIHFHHLYLIGAESLALVRNRLPNTRIVFSLHDFHPICHRDGLMVKAGSEALCSEATPDACHGCFGDISAARFSLRNHHFQNMLGLVDRFVAPSLFLRQQYDRWGLSEHMVEWIPNGVPDDSQPHQSEPRQRRNRFGFFGNIAPHKGPLLALDALSRIDPSYDLSLTIHGGLQYQGDEFTHQFEQAVQREGDRVHYYGPYTRDTIGRLMADIDWVVVPSTWWENAPLTILEAFRHGRPVIASNIGGMAELVDDGVTGLLFRRNDAADLARVINEVTSDDGLWDRMASAVPEVAPVSDIAARHIALYESLLSHPQQRSA
jgi:glycosyltransferase involved in cell wall biosynthesis